MAQFTQPQNQERDLQAITEGYEGRIGHNYWLAEAFLKDAIQNSWDARISKDWFFRIFYISKSTSNLEILGIIDSGTWGLTGTIPRNKREAVDALSREEKEKERLAYFLSSNWSNKPRTAIGSRGRGKMTFIASTRNKAIYFDSLRKDDKKYVFGKTFLDEDKAIKVEIFQGEEAEVQRRRIFKDCISGLSSPGTRVLLLNPQKQLVRPLVNGEEIRLIQHIWWEILHKYNAKIEIEIDGKKQKVPPSPFLPVEKLRVKEIFNSGIIKLRENSSFRIKNIALCYLGDKDIPDYYKGLAVQEGGMVVERLAVDKLIEEPIGSRIYGTVSFDKKLEMAMADCEGPEHYNFMWNRNPPKWVKRVLRRIAREFAKKYKLIEEQKKHTSKEQRETEIAAQSELNKLAKELGLSGITAAPRTRKGGKRSEIEKLRLSIADFKTPYENGRVDVEQTVKGAYVIPINKHKVSINVLVRAYIYYGDSTIRFTEKELAISSDELKKIGWPEIEIDKHFKRGPYTFRAKMISLEDIELNEEVRFEKGEILYHPVSRTFYVEEDPPEKGLFKIEAYPADDKRKYVWIEEGDNEYRLYYNTNHPTIEPLMEPERKEQFKDLLFKEGSSFAFSIRLTEDKNLIEDGKKPLLFTKDEVENANFQEMFLRTAFRRSKCLWERDK